MTKHHQDFPHTHLARPSETFHVLLHLFSACLAFYAYCMDADVNYMKFNPFDGGPGDESLECRMVYFTSIVMYKVRWHLCRKTL